ncbi:MAG: radical SAM protein [Spirochaetaceae bacterium]|nr:MAG: radical SAM protein [Spirochaetaceae bacterium]
MVNPPLVHERLVTTALKRANLTGAFVLGKYGLSPSMACAHGCTYCDGRAERYWVDGEFDRDIVVRPNLPELLAHELPKLRERGFISIGSGITDAYQPVEQVRTIMRGCAEVIADSGLPAVVMTKNAAVTRDLDLWRRVNERSRFLLVVSLTHADDQTRAHFEPGASRVEERIDALRAFRDAGCATGVLAMPLLPGITDTDDNLGRLYDQLARIGVDFVQPGELTLRPGRQKRWFMERLADGYPGLIAEYDRLYAEERASGAPIAAYRTATASRALRHNRRVGIPFLPPHSIYRGVLHRYDEVNVLIHHMLDLYRAIGADVGRLRSAAGRYTEWLVERKARYNRRPSSRYDGLDAELIAACSGSAIPDIGDIVQNARFADLLRSVVIDRATFDYTTLRLRR